MRFFDKVNSSEKLDFSIADIPSRKEPRRILMASPDYFDIVDVKNPHMEGQEGKVDKALALQQWETLKSHYKKLVERNILDEFLEIKGQKGCEDMVFAANQSFPWVNDAGEKVVVMSKMKHPSRKNEVKYFEEFFIKLDYKILHLTKTKLFEGMGDTIPHPGKKLLYGGFGHRTDLDAYTEISSLLNVKIVPLELKDERFYHLDTCFLPLNEHTVMICGEAFTEKGIRIIHDLFKNVIYIPVEEASGGFALNAHIISDKKNNHTIALIQKGNRQAKKYFEETSIEVIEVDTSEYMKSGGSVFCMKMMVY